ncbi:hypothetical protein LX86_008766 [Lentzea aerocolonigenes]|nr:hypothetical protein [Lentzea aerocolonigenes]
MNWAGSGQLRQPVLVLRPWSMCLRRVKYSFIALPPTRVLRAVFPDQAKCDQRYQSVDAETPTWPSSLRVSGRLMPMTDVWSPSMPSMNQPPSPSIVKPPAT